MNASKRVALGLLFAVLTPACSGNVDAPPSPASGSAQTSAQVPSADRQAEEPPAPLPGTASPSPVAAPSGTPEATVAPADRVSPESTEPSLPGLPVERSGPPVILASVRTTTRRVGDLTLPSPELADPASKARVDALIEETARGALECDMPLALETLVALRCLTDRSNTTRGARGGNRIVHFRVGVGGDVAEVPFEAFFHPGMERRTLIAMLLHHPDAPDHYAVFGERGLELNSARNVAAPPARIAYRDLAPFIRADTPLGALLAARGLSLAPAGSVMPAPGPRVRAVWASGSSGVASVVNVWPLLPRELQSQVRLVTPYGDSGAGLLFPPTSPAPAFDSLPLGGSLFAQDAYWDEAASRIEWRVTTSDTELRQRPDGQSRWAGRLPGGARVPVVVGHVNAAASDPASAWAYVGRSPSERAWARGRDLALPDTACAPPDPPMRGGYVTLRGAVELRSESGPTPTAWYVIKRTDMRGYELALHPVTRCELGERRNLWMLREPIGIAFTSKAAGDPIDLLVVIDERLSLTVLGTELEPLFTGTLGQEGRISVGVTDGLDGAATYYPVRFEAARETVSLEWTGSALVPRGSASQ